MPARSLAWREPLLAWYAVNHRDLPWRRSRDPYSIWVSEVMLQQTQVRTVLPYFERWMTRFPSVESLAEANEDEVLSLWQGLGYYRRAMLLLNGARFVRDSGWPKDEKEWRAVPGVGPYTAASIASIALDAPAAVVDGNVERVFARFTACSSQGAELLKKARAWASEVLDQGHPGEWNQALMELGATVCSPRSPACHACPLEGHCVARQTWSVENYPVSKAPPKIVHETHLVLVPFCDGKFALRRIPEGRWWAGLWEFPRVEAADGEGWERLAGDSWVEEIGRFRHQVTNHRIEVVAGLLRSVPALDDLLWHTAEELHEIAMPSPQRRVLSMARKALGLGA